ncbi:MAG: hypothetical protein ACOH2J_15900 [Allorhizobium sp.]
MALLPPSDLAKQAPEFDILGAAYVDAFRAYAQKQYLDSPPSASWPKGMVDRINAL